MSKHHIKVLFITKSRYSSYGNSIGLSKSASLTAEALRKREIWAEHVSVIDNNDIDREVTRFKPTHCVIEALWVVPAKFDHLIRLHPKIKWTVRIHSEIPFLANEGIAFEWLSEYVAKHRHPNLGVAANDQRAVRDLIKAGIPCDYLPNVYHGDAIRPKPRQDGKFHVGCFGAIRPFKNICLQALAAIDYAKKWKKHLVFHINAGRVEQKGENTLRNIEALFAHNRDNATLVSHPWLSYGEFIGLVRTMHLGMQVSFTETFNIVTADMVRCGVPVVVSPEIDWLPSKTWADPNDSSDIERVMGKSLFLESLCHFGTRLNTRYMRSFANSSTEVWLKYLRAKHSLDC